MEHLVDLALFYEDKDSFAQLYGYEEWSDIDLPDTDYAELEHIFNTERWWNDDWIPTSYERLRKT